MYDLVEIGRTEILHIALNSRGLPQMNVKGPCLMKGNDQLGY